MKFIIKDIKNEPRSLRTYRSTPGVSYDGCDKVDIRNALLNEQGFICAYCNQRIKDDDEFGNPRTSIEHYEAQANEEEKKLNYFNMLGVCNGNEGNPIHLTHCDRSRGNKFLFVNPMNSNCETFIKYDTDGSMYSNDERVEKDINEVLNLNNDRLTMWRKMVMDKVVEDMKRKYKKKEGQTYSRSDLNNEIKNWETRHENKYYPFCQVAIFYLNKKLARLT